MPDELLLPPAPGYVQQDGSRPGQGQGQGQARGRASWDGGRPSIIQPGGERVSRERADPRHRFDTMLFSGRDRDRDRDRDRGRDNWGQKEKEKEKERERPFRVTPRRRSHGNGHERNTPTPFHLTLIRRDTVNGHQWNVGTITNCLSAGSGSAQVAGDGRIEIEILTPGYKKLAEPTTTTTTTTTTATTTNTDTNVDTSQPLRFLRHLTISHPQHNTRLGPGYTQHHNAHYTFTSPWSGTCAFVMGVNGRTLKCKHTVSAQNAHNMVPSLSSLGLEGSAHPQLNSLLQAQAQQAQAQAGNGGGGGGAAQGVTATAAEIRFNLPIFSSSTSSSSSSGGTTGAASSGHRREGSWPETDSHHHRNDHNHNHTNGTHHTHTHTPSSLLSRAKEELSNHTHGGRLDLSLGRERAGGGVFGKSAKLGKLIVEDEGQKMMDLVVAACMGVWWGSYESLCL
ncbi:hypothetical protein FQN53_001310 [Emmonsiellopsis sp. PD_33]|nr:hypothetical protein FQN53_001310 [Emmonsiellopsis sp. PD_33]